MKLSVAARQLELPSTLDALIRKRAEHLSHLYPKLLACSVMVEGPGNHHRKGGPYQARIELRVPGGEPLVVSHQSSEELPVALRESFDAAKRRLQDFARLRRGQVKHHESAAR